MKLVVVKVIFEVLLVPNKRVFRIRMNYVIEREHYRDPLGLSLFLDYCIAHVSWDNPPPAVTGFFY